MATAKMEMNEELFIKKSTWSFVEEVKHEVEIHELLEKIFDDEIESPMFNLGGAAMSISVHPDCKNSGFIGVFLLNYSDQDQTCSVTFKGPAGAVSYWERKVKGAKKACGFSEFLSHGDYKEWAEENGDVFKLEVSVSLLTKEIVATDIDCWTR